jgi:DNA mismatch endonuclease, patch repair protein
MTDVVDAPTRSRMMASIRGRDTKPERVVRCFLHREGLRFRLHGRDLPGRPDIVLPRRRSIVFVHGCFWHRHSGCRFAATPKTRRQFWKVKLTANVARDARNMKLLAASGWRVFVVWECEVDSSARLGRLVRAIRAADAKVVGDRPGRAK